MILSVVLPVVSSGIPVVKFCGITSGFLLFCFCLAYGKICI